MTDAEPRRFFVPPLPVPAARHRAAWAMSFVVHATVLGLGIWFLERAATVPAPEPERMVYIEPAAPPPPPLGAAVSAPSAPVVAQPIVERPKEVPQPQRLVVPRKPKRVAPPAVAPPAIPQGVPDGSVGGVVGGVVGGEAGGQVGGVVGGRGGTPLRADQVEHPPLVVSRVLPVYPPMARARSIEGRVVLRAVIDRNGRVEEAVTVVESVPMLDAAAVEALRHWRFEPGRGRDGTAVRVLVDVPIRFQLR